MSARQVIAMSQHPVVMRESAAWPPVMPAPQVVCAEAPVAKPSAPAERYPAFRHMGRFLGRVASLPLLIARALRTLFRGAGNA